MVPDGAIQCRYIFTRVEKWQSLGDKVENESQDGITLRPLSGRVESFLDLDYQPSSPSKLIDGLETELTSESS